MKNKGKKALSLSLALAIMFAIASIAPPTMNAASPYGPSKLTNITIEIPDSGGLQFTLTNVHSSFIAEYNDLDMEYHFGYTQDTTLSCNEDLVLVEGTYSNSEDKWFSYYTKDHYEAEFGNRDYGTILETFPAGTVFNVNSMEEGHWYLSTVYLQVPIYNQGHTTRQIGFNQMNENESWEDERIGGYNWQFLSPIFPIAYLTARSTPVDGASEWAKAELMEALDADILPFNIYLAVWDMPTTRVAAAEAIVELIEASLGNDWYTISREQGWDISEGAFSDAEEYSHVTFLKHAGITTGVGDNLFDPLGSFTRAQVVTMIGRCAEVFFGVSAQGENPFSDVPDWAAPYVGYAASNGITDGVGDGLFNPNGVLQNQHTAIFCYRAFNAWK